MYANRLEDIICDFMREEIAEKVSLKKPEGINGFAGCETEYVRPKVYKGYIVAENAESTESNAYPFIVVRVIKVYNGTRQENRCRVYARVKMIFGVYCDGMEENEYLTPRQDGSGHTDLWDMMERTRIAIFERMLIGDKVSVEYEDFEMSVPDEQPMPYWHGEILMTVSMPEIVPAKAFSETFF